MEEIIPSPFEEPRERTGVPLDGVVTDVTEDSIYVHGSESSANGVPGIHDSGVCGPSNFLVCSSHGVGGSAAKDEATAESRPSAVAAPDFSDQRSDGLRTKSGSGWQQSIPPIQRRLRIKRLREVSYQCRALERRSRAGFAA